MATNPEGWSNLGANGNMLLLPKSPLSSPCGRKTKQSKKRNESPRGKGASARVLPHTVNTNLDGTRTQSEALLANLAKKVILATEKRDNRTLSEVLGERSDRKLRKRRKKEQKKLANMALLERREHEKKDKGGTEDKMLATDKIMKSNSLVIEAIMKLQKEVRALKTKNDVVVQELSKQKKLDAKIDESKQDFILENSYSPKQKHALEASFSYDLIFTFMLKKPKTTEEQKKLETITECVQEAHEAWKKQTLKKIRKKDEKKEQGAKKKDEVEHPRDFSLHLPKLTWATLKLTKTEPSLTEKLSQLIDVRACLVDAGFKTYMVRGSSGSGDCIIHLMVGASEYRLRQEAARLRYSLGLDPKRAFQKALSLGMHMAKVSRILDQNNATNSMNMWEDLHAPYLGKPPKDYLYEHNDEYELRSSSLFTANERLNLSKSIMQASLEEDGANLHFEEMLRHDAHPLRAVFPLHDPQVCKGLTNKLTKLRNLVSPPLKSIRDYYGEQVALYYCFTGFYAKYLMPASVIGVLFFISTVAMEQTGPSSLEGFDLSGTIFGVVMVFWTSTLLEHWKRKQSIIATRWGVDILAAQEPHRPDFKGVEKLDPLTGKTIFVKPKQKFKICVSWSVVVLSIMVVLLTVFSIQVTRGILSRKFGSANGGLIASLLNAVVIQVVNVLYGTVARKLNNWENHRLQSEYDDNLMVKMFLFKFINSYNALFYLAFIKKYDLGCPEDDPNCIAELRMMLVTLFAAQTFAMNILELLKPCFKARQRRKKNRNRQTTVEETQIDEEFERDSYDGSFDDFDEIVIQFGMTTLFVVAFPLTPLLALLATIAEIQIDARKMKNFVRRPFPTAASNIGNWFDILNAVAVMSIYTNLGLVIMVANVEEFEIPIVGTVSPAATKMTIYFVATQVALLARYGVDIFISDTPSWARMHVRKRDLVSGALIQDVLLGDNLLDDVDDAALHHTNSLKETLDDVTVFETPPTMFQTGKNQENVDKFDSSMMEDNLTDGDGDSDPS